jgi:hypothetical protein
MQDAVTWQNIGPCDIAGGYINGIYAWPQVAWNTIAARGTKLARISVFASANIGDVLDCETTDATPEQCPGWVTMRRNSGLAQPTVYCNTSTWPLVINAFNATGVAHPDWWIAAYPGIGAALYAGTVAHQYGDPGPIDVSVAALYWSAVDGGAPTPTPPAPVTSRVAVLL